jgi:hypothetical protein
VTWDSTDRISPAALTGEGLADGQCFLSRPAVSDHSEERFMGKESQSNHGEGNPEAADRFNTAEKAFVGSERGKKKIKEGPKVSPGEEADLAKAEQAGRDHAKDDDSQTAMRNKR